jgi:hypothetical protein
MIWLRRWGRQAYSAYRRYLRYSERSSSYVPDAVRNRKKLHPLRLALPVLPGQPHRLLRDLLRMLLLKSRSALPVAAFVAVARLAERRRLP